VTAADFDDILQPLHDVSQSDFLVGGSAAAFPA
jgi:hypothetical protein